MLGLGLMLLVGGGCGPADPLGREAISGRVDLNGAPVSEGVIEFHPLDPNGINSGATIAEGAYHIPQAKGLPPGRYKVVVSATAPSTSASPAAGADEIGTYAEELIPDRYNSQSELQIEVVEGQSEPFDFKLEK